MGYTIEITCSECGFRKVYNLGRTDKKQSLKDTLKTFHSSIVSAVQQMDKAYEMIDFEYGSQLMCCSNCHDLVEENLLIAAFKDANDYITTKYCKHCNSPLKILEMNRIEHSRCPKCLKYQLQARRICDWK